MIILLFCLCFAPSLYFFFELDLVCVYIHYADVSIRWRPAQHALLWQQHQNKDIQNYNYVFVVWRVDNEIPYHGTAATAITACTKHTREQSRYIERGTDKIKHVENKENTYSIYDEI